LLLGGEREAHESKLNRKAWKMEAQKCPRRLSQTYHFSFKAYTHTLTARRTRQRRETNFTSSAAGGERENTKKLLKASDLKLLCIKFYLLLRKHESETRFSTVGLSLHDNSNNNNNNWTIYIKNL